MVLLISRHFTICSLHVKVAVSSKGDKKARTKARRCKCHMYNKWRSFEVRVRLKLKAALKSPSMPYLREKKTVTIYKQINHLWHIPRINRARLLWLPQWQDQIHFPFQIPWFLRTSHSQENSENPHGQPLLWSTLAAWTLGRAGQGRMRLLRDTCHSR